jgi:hypothetical protein
LLISNQLQYDLQLAIWCVGLSGGGYRSSISLNHAPQSEHLKSGCKGHDQACLLIASQHHDLSLPLASGNATEAQDADFV